MFVAEMNKGDRFVITNDSEFEKNDNIGNNTL
jgi:hypothetical protein